MRHVALFFAFACLATACSTKSDIASTQQADNFIDPDAYDWRADWPDIYPLCDASTTPRCDIWRSGPRLVTCEGGREMSQPFYKDRVGGLSCSQVGPRSTPQKSVCTGVSGWIYINGAQASNIAACGSTHTGGVTSVCTPGSDGRGVITCTCNGGKCPKDPEYYLTIEPNPGALRVGEVLPLDVTSWEKLWSHDVSDDTTVTFSSSDPTVATISGRFVTGVKVGKTTVSASYVIWNQSHTSSMTLTGSAELTVTP